MFAMDLTNTSNPFSTIMAKLFYGLLLFCSVYVCVADVESGPDGNQELTEAVEVLRAVSGEWRRNDDEFRSLKKQGGMSDAEVREFAEFVDDLKHQVFDGCQEVRALGGNPDTKGVDCKRLEKELGKTPDAPEKKKQQASPKKRKPDAETKSRQLAKRPYSKDKQPVKLAKRVKKTQKRPAEKKRLDEVSRVPEKVKKLPLLKKQLDTDSKPTYTSKKRPAREERLGTIFRAPNQISRQSSQKERLGAVSNSPYPAKEQPSQHAQVETYKSQLRDLEGGIDGYLNNEIRKVKEEEKIAKQAQGWASVGGGVNSDAGGMGTAVTGGYVGETATQPDEPGAGPGVTKPGTPPQWNLPPGVGDGSDDDVVARQLREAAQAETDPETRRRLWEEYKKYKKSL